MIEAEWLDYDTADEMADAVVDDVAFVIATALDNVARPWSRCPAANPLHRSSKGWQKRRSIGAR